MPLASTSVPVDLVIDHSVQVDKAGNDEAFAFNVKREFERNQERYTFLKWAQNSFSNLQVVPPDTGIIHQINLERLAQVVMTKDGLAFPDTLVGTDSHTTMINGLGVLGWGVGGIEAEANMLGEATLMQTPKVVGVNLSGRLQPGVTATDLTLTLTHLLREHGVVGKFVEYYGVGLSNLPLAYRATIANMAPEYGATCGYFPIDSQTIDYLKLTGAPRNKLRWCKRMPMPTIWLTNLSKMIFGITVKIWNWIFLQLSQVLPAQHGHKIWFTWRIYRSNSMIAAI